MIKINVVSEGQMDISCASGCENLRKTQHHFCSIPSGSAQTESNHKETSDKLKMKNILGRKKKGTIFFKNVNVIKDKG